MEQSVTRAERANTLDAEIQYHASEGWLLRSKTASEAHLVKGKPVSHFLHLFFAIVTLGLWLLVWIPLIVFGRLGRARAGAPTAAECDGAVELPPHLDPPRP